MKLKILKEIGQAKRTCCSIEEDYSNICEICLKQEAIKWIKEIGNFDKSPGDKLWEEITGKNLKYSYNARKGIRIWIKHFFNITEEDLE